MYSGTREIARVVGVSGAVGCLDGSQVVDASDDSDLATHPIAIEAADPLLDVLEEHEPATFLLAQDEVLHDERGDAFLPFIGIWSRRTVRLPNVFDREWFTESRSVAALVSLGTEEQIRRAAEQIFARASMHVQIGFFDLSRRELGATMGMVIRAAGVDKATALGRIAAHYGVSLEETVAVGDWVNDVTMLRAAGRGFAMGQAPDEVKAAATDVLEADAYSGGGIAEAAERAGLL